MKQSTQEANAKLDEEQRCERGRSNNEHSKTVWALNHFQNQLKMSINFGSLTGPKPMQS